MADHVVGIVFLKKHATAINDYLDRRAQADFVAWNLSSKITNPLPLQEKTVFVNR